MPRIELFHNVNRDAGFGLNTVFMRKDPGGYVKEMQAGAHELVRVFECQTEWADDRASVIPLLNRAWENLQRRLRRAGRTVSGPEYALAQRGRCGLHRRRSVHLRVGRLGARQPDGPEDPQGRGC